MLTLHQIRSLRPRTKPYKVFDGKGLFLLIQPNESLLWRSDIASRVATAASRSGNIRKSI